MAYDLSSPLLVQLPKPMTPDETPENYGTLITQNQENLNQNFAELHNALIDMTARLKQLEEG